MADTRAVRERPILFSDEMVRAILDGRKTQTRRAVKLLREPPAPFNGTEPYDRLSDCHYATYYSGGGNGVAYCWQTAQGTCTCQPAAFGLYAPGDRLWVREAWTADCGITDRAFGESKWWHEVPRSLRGPKAVDYLLYRADGAVLHAPHPDPDTGYVGTPAQRASDWRPQDEDRTTLRWQPSIYMPRWACRLVLEVTEVRVERVQDISESDAMAEGIVSQAAWDGMVYSPASKSWNPVHRPFGATVAGLRGAYACLWDRLNAARGFGWSVNPPVRVVTFRRVEAP